MEILKFENQIYFYLLIAIPVLWMFFILFRITIKHKLQKFGEDELVKKLNPLSAKYKYLVKLIILSFAFAALSLAIINPQTGSKLETVKRQGVDLIIAVDVSNSMNAEDIQPNRLERSKMAIQNLIDELKGDRIGINIFAGVAYPHLPITTDYQSAKMFLSNISTDYINSQGTNISNAIELGITSFENMGDEEKETKNNKAIIIITDGEDHEEGAIKLAEEAKDKGIKVYTIGMGLQKGAPIPIYKHGIRTDYKRDKDGNTVITRLNEENLRAIAKAGDGIYVRANNSSSGLKDIFAEINKMNKQEIEAKVFKDYTDRFYLFLIISLVLFVIDSLITERKSNYFNIFK